MIPPVIVMLDEVGDGPFGPRCVVLLEPDHAIQRAVIPFDLAMRHRVIRRAAGVPQPVRLEIRGELGGEAGAIVAQQPGSMDDRDAIDAGRGAPFRRAAW